MERANVCLLLVLTIAAMTALVSCGNRPLQRYATGPIQQTAWTGHPGNLTEWGSGEDYIYGCLRRPDSNSRCLVLWKWQHGALKETSVASLPRSINVVPATEEICGLSIGKDKGPWPYGLVDTGTGNVLKVWDLPRGWGVREAGGCPNGRYIALVADDGVDAAGYEFGHPRARVALIDVEARKLRWVADLEGHGAGTIRRVVITADGRYVAIAGWNNGTAMVDTVASQVLWAKRPAQEVSTGYAAFAPDCEIIYTTGSEGCIYGIEVKTGNIVSQRWATTTGQSIYGHRASSLTVSSDGRWLAAGTGPEGEVYMWDLKRGGAAQLIRHGLGSVIIVSFSSDGKHMASVGGGVLKVWTVSQE